MKISQVDYDTFINIIHNYYNSHKYIKWSNQTMYDIFNQFQFGILQHLDIDYPIKIISDVYANYGIILLKKPTADIILIGCGNSPMPGIIRGEQYHQHGGFTTIDTDIRMNPTILADPIHDIGLRHFFMDNHMNFNVLFNEGASLSHKIAEFATHFLPFLQNVMKYPLYMGSWYQDEVSYMVQCDDPDQAYDFATEIF